MAQYNGWVTYSGAAEIVLAGALAAGAAAIVYAGLRLKRPAQLPRPGTAATIVMVALWPVAFVAFPVCYSLYLAQFDRDHLTAGAAADPIQPFTLIGTGIVFIIIALAYSSRGWRISLGSALVGALAAPMIFELPFDLIVMTRTYPAVPPDPALYRVLYFAPLLVIEVITLALVPASPVVRLSRATLWCLAGMLAAFAIWALFGFAYPAAPGPTTLNIVSKICALLAALSLFVPPRAQPGTQVADDEGRAAVPVRAWTGVM
jgi:hypothetical protein